MGAINRIFSTFGAEYRERHPELPLQQVKAIEALSNCRTGAYGTSFYHCEGCGELHAIDRSCGNRHCPQCQLHKIREWLQAQQARLLPTGYFLITFTIPDTLNPFFLAHQEEAYPAIFKAASESIKKLAEDPRHIGAHLTGFSGIMHTWGRAMPYHPHLHFIVPAGGLSKDRKKWLPAGNSFYLPVRPLSRIFRAKLKDEIDSLGHLHDTAPDAWAVDWVVHCQPAGNAEAALKYLAPYVFRVAISDQRIVKVENRMVTFTYRKVGSNRQRKMTLEVMEFIRRFLLHVLPAGFMKVRHFGFMNHNCSIPHSEIRRLIFLVSKDLSSLFADQTEKKDEPKTFTPFCNKCGAMLVYLFGVIPKRPFRAAPS